MKESVARISLSLPPELLEKFDNAAEDAGFTDRSKAIQASLRRFIVEEGRTFGGEELLTFALLIVYDHERRGIDGALNDIEHERMNQIASSVHVHLGVSHCLKIVVVRGRFSEIKALEKSVRSLKGVLQLTLILVKTEKD